DRVGAAGRIGFAGKFSRSRRIVRPARDELRRRSGGAGLRGRNRAVAAAPRARHAARKNEGAEEGLRMNCLEYELILTDIARRVPLDAAARERALTHAGQCAACADRLEAQRQLSEELRFWGVSQQEQAPPALEARLRHAFRRKKYGWVKFAAAG